MPGVTVSLDCTAEHDCTRRRLSASLHYESHTPDYRSLLHRVNDRSCVGVATYPDYPILLHATANALVAVDGAVYDGSPHDVIHKVDEIDSAPDRGNQIAMWLGQWLSDRDAECVIVYAERDPNGTVVIANDVLGRLPFYYSQSSRCFVASRSLRHIVAVQNGSQPDPLGVAQSLIFGYSLGSRTYIRDISMLAPASVMTISQTTGAMQTTAYNHWCLEADDSDPSRPQDADAQDLAELFVDCTRQRRNTFTDRSCVLFLSGGLDSRSVAGALVRGGCSATALTRDDGTPVGGRERATAQHIAAACGLPWEWTAFRQPYPWEYQRIIELRDGLNYGAMATQLQSHRAAAAVGGDDCLVFTGDGGDKVMPYLRPPRRLRTVRQLAEMVSAQTSFLGIQRAAALIGCTEQQVLESVEEAIESYPEASIEDRFVHYMVFERGRRWLFEGEERARAFQWATSPFYAIPFFRRALSIPWQWKQSGRWYAVFLRALSEKLATIPDVNTGRPPGTPPRFRAKIKALVSHSPRLERFVRDLYTRKTLPKPIPWQPLPVAELLESASAAALFNRNQIEHLLSTPQPLTIHWQVITVLWSLHQFDKQAELEALPKRDATMVIENMTAVNGQLVAARIPVHLDNQTKQADV
ncbi:MAG: hypothetical protein GF341_02995 [candidate division Zixibacteria bacterium]|nr:hypothetical protein [candidate division Zixibacteria bacterium]